MKIEPTPEIVFAPEPDPLEKKIRIGCGSVFGLVAGFVAGLVYWPTAVGIGIFVSFSAIGCAWMALKLGDRFWKDKAINWLSWW